MMMSLSKNSLKMNFLSIQAWGTLQEEQRDVYKISLRKNISYMWTAFFKGIEESLVEPPSSIDIAEAKEEKERNLPLRNNR